MVVIKKLLAYGFTHSRTEFHGAVIVLLYTAIYWLLSMAADLILSLFGWHIVVDYQIVGLFVGCIGAGELSRAFTKLYLVKSAKFISITATAMAGATVGLTFGFQGWLKWQSFAAEYLVLWAMMAGAVFYLVLHWFIYLDKRNQA